MGNNPDATGGYMDLPELGMRNEAEIDRELKRQAIEYIKKEPVQFLSRTVVKIFKLHDRETIGVVWNENGIINRYGEKTLVALKVVSSLYWYPVLILGLSGVVQYLMSHKWRDIITFMPIILWLYYTLVHCTTVVNDRYHVPSIPFIAILGGYALHCLLVRRKPINPNRSISA